MRKIGRFTITRKLGAGGMGVVYAAHDPTRNCAVALKVLAGDEVDRTDLRRFEREAWAAAQVKHPNTVAVLDAGEADGKPYIVMELVDGQTAGQVVDRRGPLPWVTATKVIISACKGLAAVHAAGLVHRDVKPGNVMVSVDGVVKLADFGLAKIANRTTRSLTGAGTVGTPHFMSPEQCHNEPVDGRTDIYALGATYYVMLTNATPYTGEHELQVMYAHCNEPVPDPRNVVENVPPGCAAVVRKAMAKSPADRYQWATGMEAALERVIASNGAAGAPTAEHAALDLPPSTVAAGPVVPRGWLRDGRVTRRRLLLAVPAAGLIGATAYYTWPYFRRQVAEPPDPPNVFVPKRETGAAVEDIAVSGSGRWLAVAVARGVNLYDRSKGAVGEDWTGWPDEHARAVAISADGTTLAAGVGKTLRAVRPRDRKPIEFENTDVGGTILGLAFSPDGKLLAAAVHPDQQLGEPIRPGFVLVWDVETRKLARRFGEKRQETIGGVSFSSDNTTLAVAWRMHDMALDPVVELWNAARAELLEPTLTVAHAVNGPYPAFARSAARLLIACGQTFYVFKPLKYEPPKQWPPLRVDVSAAALSPDGTVAAVAVPNAIYLSRPEREQDSTFITEEVPEMTKAMAFADEQTLISASLHGRISEWRVPGT